MEYPCLIIHMIDLIDFTINLLDFLEYQFIFPGRSVKY